MFNRFDYVNFSRISEFCKDHGIDWYVREDGNTYVFHFSFYGRTTLNVNTKVRYYDESNILTRLKKWFYRDSETKNIPEIVDVKFNGPATIVFWSDNTKTIVRCQEGDYFDPEKGLAMAIAKKYLGNHGNYFETMKKWIWIPKPDETSDTPYTDLLRTMLGVKKKEG